MSQNPNAQHRPDEEGGEGASRSSGKKDKGGLMAKLRAMRLAQLLGAAPVVAPAAGLAAAAAISAPDPASAQDEGDNEDEPSAREYFREDTPAPAPAENSESPRTPKPPAKEKEEEKPKKETDAAEKDLRRELEELYALVKPAICEKFDLPATCSPEEVQLAIEAGKEPLNREEVFAYIYALIAGLVLVGTALGGIIRSQSGKRQDLQTQLQDLLDQLEKIGIREGMTAEKIQPAVLKALRQAKERENQPGSQA